MFLYTEDEEDYRCIYTPKYGQIPLNSKAFDDHSLLGEDFYKYKPEKIKFWLDNKERISGIQTFFKNIIDSETINSGENKGLDSLNYKEFTIDPNEYLNRCEIWTNNESVTYIFLATNKNNKFFVGKQIGTMNIINQLSESKKEKIIISFFGSYDRLMNGFGLHLMDKSQFLSILFTGYFELKHKLQKEEYKNEILNKMNNNNYNKQDETIIRTCLLPSPAFNVIMKFCVI